MISKNLKKRIYTSLALLLLIFLIFNSYMVLTYSLILLSVLSILEFLRYSPSDIFVPTRTFSSINPINSARCFLSSL